MSKKPGGVAGSYVDGFFVKSDEVAAEGAKLQPKGVFRGTLNMFFRLLRIAAVLAVLFIFARPGTPTFAEANYHLSDADIASKVLNYVKQYYVEPQRIDAIDMLKGGLDQLQRAVPEILAQFDGRQSVALTIDQATRKFSTGSVGNIGDLAHLTKEIFSFIELHYHGKTDARDLEYMVIDGMLNALDPHSSLLTPKIYNEFKIGTKGNFGGIGIAIGSKDGELTVISPIEGTPAWRAGLKANDKITQIGEESTINMSLTEAVEKLRGRVGTTVALTIERGGRPPFTVTLKRAMIEIDSVQSSLLQDNGAPVGYIKIKSFQENTDKDFNTHLARITQQAGGNLEGLILDLRNNPGGLLQQAVSITDKVLEEGVIVSTVGAHSRFLEQDNAHRDGDEPKFPIIVLVNEGSASASEIVTGALQFHKRALVLGSQTFGKGSVQTVYDLRDGSALKLTIAQYLPGGKQVIQTVGVTPDVELVPVTIDKQAMNIVEDEHASERDLEKHLAAEAHGARTAQYRLRYLVPPETSPSEDETTRREYSNKVDISKDFPAKIAAQLLSDQGWKSQQDHSGLANAIRNSEPTQEKDLEAAMQKVGVDWRRGPITGKPQLQVTYQLQSKDGQQLKSIVAGEEATLVLTARNIGSGAYSQLVGSTTSDEPFLANKEFVFGYIAPGQARNWGAAIKVPRHISTANIPVTVSFQEANLNKPSSFTAMVPIQGTARPQFAYSYRLGPPTGSKVKPQGLLPVGKSVPLFVEVKNVGEGTSSETVAALKNLEGKGPFIEMGRIKLGKLALGGIAKGQFRIHLEPGFDAATFKMELSITDGAMLESISNQLQFTVGSGDIVPAAGPWYQGPQIQVSGLTLPFSTAAGKQRIQGKITDDQSVKDAFIFVGDEKVYYQTNASGGGSYSLDTEVPLKAGANLVTIAARDNNDLLSRRTLFILRTGENSTAMKQ